MKKILFFVSFILFSFSLCATSFCDDKKKKKSEDVIVMPEFPGGQEKMFDYIILEAKFPYEAQQKEVEGEVLVAFTVEHDGYISMAKVLKGVSPELDAEAVRVVKSMPKWIPGTRNGRPVRAELTIPINFKLIRKFYYYDGEAEYNGIDDGTVRDRKRRWKR